MERSNENMAISRLALAFLIIGIIFPVSFRGYTPIGDIILNSVGLKAWSRVDTGFHYTSLYSLIMFAVSAFLGYKYRHNSLAKIGGTLSFAILIIAGTIFISLVIRAKLFN